MTEARGNDYTRARLRTTGRDYNRHSHAAGYQGWVHNDETAGLAQRFVAGHFWASPNYDRRF